MLTAFLTLLVLFVSAGMVAHSKFWTGDDE